MAAVMRAMSGMGSLGKTHSRSESTGDQPFSARVSSEELGRTTSRLVPPGSAAPSPGGILISSNHPYAANSSAASSVASIPRSTSASDLARLNTPTTRSRDTSPAPGRIRENAPLSPPMSSALASLSAADSERGRSRSSSRHGPAESTDSAATTARSIRFAPLPEVRQRSYSTGRNIWYEDEDITDGMLTEGHDGPKRDLVRRDAPDQMDFPEHALADSSSEEDSAPAGIFGSWKSDLGMGGGRDKDRDRDEPSSYTVKLLRPLSFGLVGKKRLSMPKPGRRPSTADASDLARTESNESDVSRGSSEQVVHKSTGIPMRKTRTWELGETPTSGRRANYPPVAQRSRRPTSTKSVSAPEPAFVEWGWGKEGSGKGVGSVRSAKAAATNAADDDDDDGGGMAWVKRRKAEREAAAAKKKADDEASAAVAELMEPTAAPSDSVVTPEVVVSAPPLISGTTTPVPSASLLSASRPALYVVTPSLDSSLLVDQNSAEASPSHTAASLSTTTTPSTESSSSVSSGDVGKTPTPTGVHSSEGDDSDSDDDRGDDDDSDLDEEELAQEEALAEAARMTSKSAASERYHDKNHTTRMLKVDTQ